MWVLACPRRHSNKFKFTPPKTPCTIQKATVLIKHNESRGYRRRRLTLPSCSAHFTELRYAWVWTRANLKNKSFQFLQNTKQKLALTTHTLCCWPATSDKPKLVVVSRAPKTMIRTTLSSAACMAEPISQTVHTVSINFNHSPSTTRLTNN
jgi:hypothetical protein